MILWNDSMSTRIALVDEQHKMLFQRCNDFSAVISDITAREKAGEILDFLQFYIIWHFGEEEKYMEQYQCDFADENKAGHAEFIKTFHQFYLQWQDGSMTPALARAAYEELEKWLVNHVLWVDTQLYKYVNKVDPGNLGFAHSGTPAS